MWFDILFWVALIVILLWILKKSGILLRLLEANTRKIYDRLNPEEKPKFDAIIEEERRKNVENVKIGSNLEQ